MDCASSRTTESFDPEGSSAGTVWPRTGPVASAHGRHARRKPISNRWRLARARISGSSRKFVTATAWTSIEGRERGLARGWLDPYWFHSVFRSTAIPLLLEAGHRDTAIP